MKRNYLLILALFFTLSNYGQFVVAVDRANGPGPTNAGTAPNMSAIGLTRASGPNGPTQNAGPNNFSSRNWSTASTPNLNKYLEWSVSIDAGYSVILTAADISLKRNANGPKKLQLYFSYDGFATSTASVIKTLTTVDKTDLVFTLPVALSSGGNVTFRLYGYDAQNANGVLNVVRAGVGEFNINNPGIKIRGIITPIDLVYSNGGWLPTAPNPSTFGNNAIVKDGTYTFSDSDAVNNLEVRSLGNIIVPNNVTAYANTTTLESTSTNYPSLIVRGSGVLTGLINYKRHANTNNGEATTTGKNDLISSPLGGQTFGEFADANQNIVSDPNNNARKLFGPFNKSTGTYQIYNTTTDGSVVLTPGTGYRAASSDNGNFIFTGSINNENYNISILNSGPDFQEWNLIGNPYPSYIELDKFLALNNSQFSGISSGVYGYDGEASDGYTIWNQAYSDANPGAAITPGQGFLVASKAGGGTIKFRRNMRTVGNTDDFIVGRNSSDNAISYLKLNATNGELNANTDFYFTNNATLGLDPGYDSGVFGSISPAFSLYSRLAQGNVGVNLAVQSIGLSDLDNDVMIPLGINAAQGQEVTVSIAQSTLSSEVEVYLEDTVTGTFTLLNTSDYVFTSNTNLNGTGRFFLRFADQAALSNPDNQISVLQIFTTASPRALFIKGQLSATTTVEMYDVQGRKVLSKILEGSSNSNQVDVSSLSSGIYVVKLNNTTQQKTQKVILK